jgi:uncharacterized protein YaeQ
MDTPSNRSSSTGLSSELRSPGPLQLRVALAHVDRGLELVGKLIVGRDPETPPEHVMLRALAWCLFHEDGLRVADGPPRRDVPDLVRVDGGGKTTSWIACGASDGEEVRRVVLHNRGVVVRALFAHEGPRDHFVHQLAGIKKRPLGFDDVEIWSIDAAAPARLAARDELRQRWAVTVVGDHIYVDSDGVKVDSPLTRTPVPAFSA